MSRKSCSTFLRFRVNILYVHNNNRYIYRRVGASIRISKSHLFVKPSILICVYCILVLYNYIIYLILISASIINRTVNFFLSVQSLNHIQIYFAVFKSLFPFLLHFITFLSISPPLNFKYMYIIIFFKFASFQIFETICKLLEFMKSR